MSMKNAAIYEIKTTKDAKISTEIKYFNLVELSSYSSELEFLKESGIIDSYEINLVANMMRIWEQPMSVIQNMSINDFVKLIIDQLDNKGVLK